MSDTDDLRRARDAFRRITGETRLVTVEALIRAVVNDTLASQAGEGTAGADNRKTGEEHRADLDPPTPASDPAKGPEPGAALDVAQHARLLDGLKDRLKLKYIGDCKCGSCQLVPDHLLQWAVSRLGEMPSLDRAWHVGESRIAELEASLAAAKRERDEAFRERQKLADRWAELNKDIVAERDAAIVRAEFAEKSESASIHSVIGLSAELAALRGRMAEATRKAAAIRDATNEYAAPPTPWLVSAWMRDLAALLTDPAPERNAPDGIDDFWRQHSDWSNATFGDESERGPLGPLRHLEKEAREAQESTGDIIEYADCLMLILDATRRAGFDLTALIAAAYRKLEINKARAWPTTAKDQAVEHRRDHRRDRP